MRPKNFLIAILLPVALAAGFFLAVRLNEPVEPKAAFVLPEPMALPEFSLIDAAGNAVTRETFRHHWNLLFFGFTHCPDICPTTLQILSAAKNQLGVDGQETLPRIVLISVDPERDTPDIVGQYVDYFGEGNLGVTGDLEELRKLTGALGIYFERQPGDDPDYNVDHSAAVLVVNPNGKFHALFGGPHIVDNYVHDLPLLFDAYGAFPQPPLAASNIIITQPVPGHRMSAGYLTMHNNTDKDIRITRVTSAQYGSVEVHESTIEDGVARMRALPELVIPAHGAVTLERGGKHLMLMRPTGDTDSASLQFFDDDALLLTVSAPLAAKPD